MADFDGYSTFEDSGSDVATIDDSDVEALLTEEADTDAAEAEAADQRDDDADSESGDDHASRPKGSARPRAQFGWSEIESILGFVRTYDDGTAGQQAALKAAFGLRAKQDSLSVAQALHSTADIPVYRDAKDFIEKIIAGEFGVMEVLGLVSELSKREDDYVSRFFRSVNAFLRVEVRYRKNAAIPDLLMPLVTKANEALNDDAEATIQWIDGLLAVWPK